MIVVVVQQKKVFKKKYNIYTNLTQQNPKKLGDLRNKLKNKMNHAYKQICGAC